MRRVSLLLVLSLLSCATPPTSVDRDPSLTPREREARLLLEMERMKKQERGQLTRLLQQARKGGQEFLSRQERESPLHSIELYRTLLARYPDNRSDYMAEASFRLAELLFETERERIRTVLEEEGDTADIVPDFTAAIEAYAHVAERFPGHPLVEDALYGLAYCYTEQGDPDQAALGYSRLVEVFPQTRYAVEINMRLGEYFFTMEELPRAIEHYRYVVNNGEPEYVEKALYKMGWCYYNLDDYEAAIDSFFAVLDLNRNGALTIDSLVDESMDVIARSYSESTGTPGLVRKLRSRLSDPHAPVLLNRLADLYRERSFFPEAVGTYRTYISLYPEGESLPEVLQHLRETYHIRGDTLASLELAEKVWQYIGQDTPWYAAATPERREEARRMLLENLEAAAGRRRALSQAGGRENELAMALEDLTVYQEIAARETPCRILHMKGIVLTELNRYPEAVLTLNGVALEERCRETAQQAVLASTAFQIGTYEKRGDVDLTLFEDSVNILARLAPGNPATTKAILALGEVTLNAGKTAGARVHFSRLIREYPDTAESVRARFLIARTFFKEGDYRQAAAWFRESLRNAREEESAKEARRLLVYSLFKYAEELSGSGKTSEAAERFESIYRQFPESDVAQVSLYNAGKLFRTMGLERKATSLFETLARTYTESEYATEALQMSVLILEALGDPVRAADDSMFLARRSSGTERAEALLKAAQLYTAGNEQAQAASSRSAYIREFPEPVEELSRQQFLLGLDLEAIGSQDQAREVHLRNVGLQKKHPENDTLLQFAARSQLRVAERAFRDYESYTIVPPVEEAVLRKREMLQRVIREFVAAGEYRTADVITASNFFIGRALELFKEDILSSPKPQGLAGVELEEYDLLLQEMAFPFEEKALEAYRVNIQRSITLELLDPWIERSYTRMAEMAPWAYQRDETVAYPTTLIEPRPLDIPPLPGSESRGAAGRTPTAEGKGVL